MDPANHKSIMEIQAERAAAEAPNKSANQPSSSTAPTSSLTPMSAPASISVLRQKLQDKLDSFKRRKQPAVIAPNDGTVEDEEADADDENMTAHSRDEMIEETRRRRGEVRDNRRAKRKAERKEEKEGKGKKVIKTGKVVEEGKGKGKEDFKAKPGKVSLDDVVWDMKFSKYPMADGPAAIISLKNRPVSLSIHCQTALLHHLPSQC
jgi:hypothetical protein